MEANMVEIILSIVCAILGVKILIDRDTIGNLKEVVAAGKEYNQVLQKVVEINKACIKALQEFNKSLEELNAAQKAYITELEEKLNP